MSTQSEYCVRERLRVGLCKEHFIIFIHTSENLPHSMNEKRIKCTKLFSPKYYKVLKYLVRKIPFNSKIFWNHVTNIRCADFYQELQHELSAKFTLVLSTLIEKRRVRMTGGSGQKRRMTSLVRMGD